VSKSDSFKNKQFDVEHALSTYATSYVYMPADHIYHEATIKLARFLVYPTASCSVFCAEDGRTEAVKFLTTEVRLVKPCKKPDEESPKEGNFRAQDLRSCGELPANFAGRWIIGSGIIGGYPE
jgi:hypothetical protein